MNPAGGWTETDRLLATAAHLDDEARCPGCGQYVDEAHDPDMDGGFEVHEVVCNACAAKERWQRDHEKTRPEPGTLTWVKKLAVKPRKRRRRSG